MKKAIVIAGILATTFMTAKVANNSVPGLRTLVLAHNAYPDHGKYGDRLDRVIATGKPFVVEQDLSWIDGKSLMIHGAKNIGSDDPTLDSYFFPKVKPLLEKALKEGNKGSWPVVTLYLDIKNDPIEHLEAISKMLDQYDMYLTTAIKPADDNKQAPLTLKPMMILVEDKQKDIKRNFFYSRVPVGGKVRVFGTAAKVGAAPELKLSKAEAVDYMATLTPEEVFTEKADTYRRWFGGDWALIEKGGQQKAGEWTKDKETRLRQFVDYGHRMGYFVSLYCLNGYTQQENQGWDKDYNFGSKEQVLPRWKAAVHAKADFISTDQYEDLASVISTER